MRESGGWLCAVSFGPDLGQGALPENVIRKFRTLKNGLLWLFFRKGIPRLVSAAIVMEEACIFRM